MEPENPLDPSSPLAEEQLAAFVRRVDGPAPSADFVRRTMRAVKRAPLAPGRKRLRDPLATLVGWAALIAGVALSALMVAVTSPVVGAVFSQIIGRSVSLGVWLTNFSGPALALANVLTTIGLAVAKAAATKEGTAGLLMIAVMGAVSLSALHRLLMTEGEDSQWQEIS